MALLLARHGEKESESGPCNWRLLLTPGGVGDVRSSASQLLARGLAPTRVLCSPYPRTVETAALYAQALGLPSLCIEPALCEVLTPHTGSKGLPEGSGGVPAWTLEELAQVAARHAPAVRLDAAYAPLLPVGELRREATEHGREETQARIERLAAALGAAGPGPTLIVSHGSPLRRLADLLCPGGAPFSEPAMGTVMHVEKGAEGGWRVRSVITPATRSAQAAQAAVATGDGAVSVAAGGAGEGAADK